MSIRDFHEMLSSKNTPRNFEFFFKKWNKENLVFEVFNEGLVICFKPNCDFF